MLHRRFLIGFSWALLLVPSLPHAATVTVTLNPDKDNTLCQQDDGSKSNALGDIYVGRTGEESSISERRGVISFDVAAVVPAGATINSATLRLYLSRVNTSSAANISIYKASATWGEGTSYYDGGLCADSTTDDATWIHRSYNDLTQLWQAAGGDFAVTASQSTSVGTTLQYYEWISNSAMVADVQDWLDNPGANAGWVVVNDAPVAGDVRRFRSREQITNKPELVVDYTPR